MAPNVVCDWPAHVQTILSENSSEHPFIRECSNPECPLCRIRSMVAQGRAKRYPTVCDACAWTYHCQMADVMTPMMGPEVQQQHQQSLINVLIAHSGPRAAPTDPLEEDYPLECPPGDYHPGDPAEAHLLRESSPKSMSTVETIREISQGPNGNGTPNQTPFCTPPTTDCPSSTPPATFNSLPAPEVTTDNPWGPPKWFATPCDRPAQQEHPEALEAAVAGSDDTGIDDIGLDDETGMSYVPGFLQDHWESMDAPTKAQRYRRMRMLEKGVRLLRERAEEA
ncbi:hypothetical protein ESCO_006200 [Escovopsis weberi]|uniref:Uncharacterized protein n=1 Tax=Escovopsis weberi TaxID=150374 RepID=A0A0M8MWS3_ESCWE|nr:hypothetical protein ESCO_006200 [Escovopsis weberi]